jgi:hypothetical protein
LARRSSLPLCATDSQRCGCRLSTTPPSFVRSWTAGSCSLPLRVGLDSPGVGRILPQVKEAPEESEPAKLTQAPTEEQSEKRRHWRVTGATLSAVSPSLAHTCSMAPRSVARNEAALPVAPLLVEFFAFLRVLHNGALAAAFSVRDVLAWSAFVADTAVTLPSSGTQKPLTHPCASP